MVVPAPGPCVLPPLAADQQQAFVPGEVLGCARRPVSAQVIGRSTEHAAVAGQFLGNQPLVGWFTKTHGHIKTALDQFNGVIGQFKDHFHRGKFRVVSRHHVGHVLAPETQAGIYAQQATRGVLPGTQGGFQRIKLAKNLCALFQVTFALGA